jgi:5-methylcytosine-specific restriction endonuclease McrA
MGLAVPSQQGSFPAVRYNITANQAVIMGIEARTCWICGNPADSREHKFKKTDLAHSGKSWAPADQPYFVSENGWRRIPGPNSRLVKFEKVLCQPCNNARTQPFDRAYERFAEWVDRKDANLLNETLIDFTEIYGANFQDGVLNLLKYFAKHLGCRIASDNYSMPPNLAASLATNDLLPFEVSLALNPGIGEFPVRGHGVLHNFPLIGMFSPTTGAVHEPYISGMIVGHLDVVYRYSYRHRFAWEGDQILPSDKTVQLGKVVPDAPHLARGQIPGADTSRRVNIEGEEFDVPLLPLDHIRQISSLPLPTSDMAPIEIIDAKLRIAHAILLLFYPDVTLEFLEENLTNSDAEKLWLLVFPR